jgi:hypothetical protein
VAEVQLLASTVPSAVVGNVTVIGVPLSATATQTISGILAIPSLVTAQTLTLQISIWPTGSITPSTLQWSGTNTAPLSFSISLLDLPASCNCGEWTVTYTLSGANSGSYLLMPSHTIVNDSTAFVENNAAFRINTDLPNLRAKWRTGVQAGTGVVYGTGYSSGHHLLLSGDSSDSRSTPFPSKMGIASQNQQPTGFALGGWFFMNVVNTQPLALLTCATADGVSADSFYVTMSTNAFYATWYRDTTQSGPSAFYGTAPVPGQWFHFVFSMDPFGQFGQAWLFLVPRGQPFRPPVSQAVHLHRSFFSLFLSLRVCIRCVDVFREWRHCEAKHFFQWSSVPHTQYVRHWSFVQQSAGAEYRW